MQFKVGDRVRITYKRTIYHNMLGIIVDTSNTIVPYYVEFKDNKSGWYREENLIPAITPLKKFLKDKEKSK